MRRELWCVLVFFLTGAMLTPARGSGVTSNSDRGAVGVEMTASAEQVVELWRGANFNHPYSVSVNRTDDTCWVTDQMNNQVVHLAPDGTQLWRGGGFTFPSAATVNPTDGSCWVADQYGDQVVHLAQSGAQLWRGGGFDVPFATSVDPTDGSCWVADDGDEQVIHLAQDGTQLWRGGGFLHPWSVSVNPTDSTCWVADFGNNQVVHLAESGTQLWRGGDFAGPWSVSADPVDGSCWVADYSHSQVVHLDAGGAELWRSDSYPTFFGPVEVSVNPTDGSCWVADAALDEVVHLAQDGTELWRGGGFSMPRSVSANPTDGSCWVADMLVGAVVHLGIQGVPFTDVNQYHWAYRQVVACAQAGIVGGYPDGTYHPEEAVTRAQMAVYVSRALAGGDGNVPPGPSTATFPDVPMGYWAFKHVEYCSDEGIVGGYWDGYRPEETVNRAQMAVYMARAMVGGDANVPTGPATAFFPDVPTSYWAFKYVEYCHDQGVVGGYWDGYHPEETVNRAQMAVYVQRAFELPM